MEKQNLTTVMSGFLFRIPDYQRGYAWEEPQLKDFVQDIDALVDENVQSHYTGTLVIYQPKEAQTKDYGIDKCKIVDVVDGQQRLTTSSLYLSIILNKLINEGETAHIEALRKFVAYDSCTKLTLNNDTSDIYFDLISTGIPKTTSNTVHQKRLIEAYNYLKTHIDLQLSEKKDAMEYLKRLYDAITRKLNFSFYTIELESEIGMTFELMNSRGKDLSALELVKNYLMYWIYRNTADSDKENLTRLINKTWKDVYTNIAACNGNENQCLRITWILYVNHLPKNWQGYVGFKDNTVIPIRDFSEKKKEEVSEFIKKITNGLSEVSHFYSLLLSSNELSKEEQTWVAKIKNAGNIANFLPLMVAAKIKRCENNISEDEYIALLKSMEKYSYRVFLWAQKRSNAGISSFYRWASELFRKEQNITAITGWIYDTCGWYSKEPDFRTGAVALDDWYSNRKLVKYTLFEYELYLLSAEGKGLAPKLSWADLSDSTIEHILPQNPATTSQWMIDWTPTEMNECKHDIANLVLTLDNSHYSNFDFCQKKGNAGAGHCYANSDIRQERKISEYMQWDAATLRKRKVQLSEWIISRWGIDKRVENITIDDNDDDQ